MGERFMVVFKIDTPSCRVVATGKLDHREFGEFSRRATSLK